MSLEWPAALFLRRWTASYSSSSSFLRSSSSSASSPSSSFPSRRFHSSFVRVTDCYGARRSIDTRSIPCKQVANAIGVEGDACRKRRTTVSIRCIRGGRRRCSSVARPMLVSLAGRVSLLDEYAVAEIVGTFQ